MSGGYTPAEYAKFIAGEQKIWKDIVKRAQIKAYLLPKQLLNL